MMKLRQESLIRGLTKELKSPPEKGRKKFVVELVLAREEYMTVKKLVDCEATSAKRVRIIIAPLHVVRGGCL